MARSLVKDVHLAPPALLCALLALALGCSAPDPTKPGKAGGSAAGTAQASGGEPGSGNGESPASSSSGDGTGKANGSSDGNSNGATGEAAGCIDDGDPFNVDALRAGLSFLASPEIGGRVPGTPGDVAVRAHIEAHFRCLGLLPGADGGSYQQGFTNVLGQQTANVIGYIPGNDPVVGREVIIVSAHHDHFGNGRLGANDNASGVVGMLAVAQYMKQQNVPPRRTVAFVAFGSEEPTFPGPYYTEGSARFVMDAPGVLPLERVVYVVNFDMIGTYVASDETVYAIGSVPGTPAVPLLNALRPFSGLDVGVGDGGEEGGSDHYPFCVEGIPYVFFWTDDPECYHRTCDTADRIDYPQLGLIAKLGAQLTEQLANTNVDLAAYRANTEVAQLGCTE